MEKVVVLRRAVEKGRSQWGAQTPANDILRHKLQQYADLLASQGELGTAYGYLAQDSQVRGVGLQEEVQWGEDRGGYGR